MRVAGGRRAPARNRQARRSPQGSLRSGCADTTEDGRRLAGWEAGRRRRRVRARAAPRAAPPSNPAGLKRLQGRPSTSAPPVPAKPALLPQRRGAAGAPPPPSHREGRVDRRRRRRAGRRRRAAPSSPNSYGVSLSFRRSPHKQRVAAPASVGGAVPRRASSVIGRVGGAAAARRTTRSAAVSAHARQLLRRLADPRRLDAGRAALPPSARRPLAATGRRRDAGGWPLAATRRRRWHAHAGWWRLAALQRSAVGAAHEACGASNASTSPSCECE